MDDFLNNSDYLNETEMAFTETDQGENIPIWFYEALMRINARLRKHQNDVKYSDIHKALAELGWYVDDHILDHLQPGFSDMSEDAIQNLAALPLMESEGGKDLFPWHVSTMMIAPDDDDCDPEMVWIRNHRKFDIKPTTSTPEERMSRIDLAPNRSEIPASDEQTLRENLALFNDEIYMQAMKVKFSSGGEARKKALRLEAMVERWNANGPKSASATRKAAVVEASILRDARIPHRFKPEEGKVHRRVTFETEDTEEEVSEEE